MDINWFVINNTLGLKIEKTQRLRYNLKIEKEFFMTLY